MDVALIQVPYMIGDERQGKGPQRLVQAGAAELFAVKGVSVTEERVDRGGPFRDSGNASLAVNKRLGNYGKAPYVPHMEREGMILRMWRAQSTARKTTADEQRAEANGFHESCCRY